MLCLKNELTGALIGLARASEGNEDIINEETNQVILEGLAATLPNANYNHDTLKGLLDRVQAEKKRLVPNCFSCASSCGRTDNFDMQLLEQEEEDIRAVKSLILFNIRSIAAYVYQVVSLGYSMEQEMMSFFYNTLVIIGMKDCGMAVLTSVVIETGKMYLKCVEVLERE